MGGRELEFNPGPLTCAEHKNFLTAYTSMQRKLARRSRKQQNCATSWLKTCSLAQRSSLWDHSALPRPLRPKRQRLGSRMVREAQRSGLSGSEIGQRSAKLTETAAPHLEVLSPCISRCCWTLCNRDEQAGQGLIVRMDRHSLNRTDQSELQNWTR